jgi:starvation-inducible DNA-binding protein
MAATTKTAPSAHVTADLGLTDKEREGVVQILNQTLADEYVLYTKTRNYHWNVTGSDFGALHKFFETQYEQLDETLDEIAERARSLGGIAAGAMEQFLQLARLHESTGGGLAAQQMLHNLLADHEALIRHLRVDLERCAGEYHDIGTNDFLTGVMEQHEKMAWMLRAHLEGA